MKMEVPPDATVTIQVGKSIKFWPSLDDCNFKVAPLKAAGVNVCVPVPSELMSCAVPASALVRLVATLKLSSSTLMIQ